MNSCFKLSVLASALALAMGPASAADVYLAAKVFSKALPLSGGGTESVTMWGYVEDTGDGDNAHCFDITGAGSAAARRDCVDALGDPSVPGPRLTIPAGDPLFRIYLTNGLPEPTSIVIPGQKLPFSSTTESGPTWNDGSTGGRTGDGQRVRSYGLEAAAEGGRRVYVWANARGSLLERTGTFIYHSGTSPQRQVYMGLYGAVTKDAVAADVATETSAEAYAGVPYDNEVVLFYSDVDPVHNAAVAAGDMSYTPIHYNAKWFLINGESYEVGMADIPAGSAVTGPGDTRSNTLLRLLSTASETHVPTLQGLYMDIHAEDGFRYTWQSGPNFGGFAPREQYSAMLSPLKTMDAVIASKLEGRYAVYDGNGYMTNPSDTGNFGQADELGGMLRFLSVGMANQAPVAVDDSVTTDEDTPVDINVVLNDSDPNGDGLTIISVTQGAVGSVAISDPACCVLYTPDPNVNGLDSFDYTVTDSNGVTSTATALVNITIAAVNDPPSITSTPTNLTATTGLPYDGYDVEATDIDLGDTPPDVLSFSLDAFPAGMQIDPNSGVISWTPTVQQSGTQAVTARVQDLGGLFDTQSFNIEVTLVNNPPAITSTAGTTATVNAAYSYDVDATDGDLGDTQTYALDVSPTGMTIDAGTGVINWTPTLFQLGANNVTVSVTDFNGAVATQSYAVDVAAAGAEGPLFFVTNGNGTVPGVTGPYNNADIYAHDGAAYQRVLAFVATMGFNANVDALDMVDADTFYVSFANTTVNVPGIGLVQDEDVVLYDAGTWSMHFDGALCGLDTSNGQDINAIAIDGGTLYFSTVGGGNGNPVGGAPGPYDDADVYTWTGGAAPGGANCGKAVDASGTGSDWGLPGNADIDGLTVRGGTYYVSFAAATTTVPGFGSVNDEAVMSYDGTSWSLYFSGPGLNNSNAQDTSGFDLP